ncbi:MAG: tyrosine-type recombinase/integrase [Betaproteobacteria bacterium]
MPALIAEAVGKIPNLAASTRAQYKHAAAILSEAFAEFAPDQVEQRHIAQFRQAMSDRPNMANRCLSVLRQVFAYAVEQQLVASNPAIGIKPHREAKRGRLLTLAEFHAIREQAGPRLQCVVDLLAMTGQRVSDILALRRDALREDGIYVRQGKTGAQVLIRWTPELRAVVERAKTLHGNVRAFTLLHGRAGKPVDYRTLRDQWALACERAGVADAHLHDLRAMSATMAQQQGLDPQGLLGHTSPAMTKRYLRDRSPTVVDGPSIGQVLDVGQKRA